MFSRTLSHGLRPNVMQRSHSPVSYSSLKPHELGLHCLYVSVFQTSQECSVKLCTFPPTLFYLAYLFLPVLYVYEGQRTTSGSFSGCTSFEAGFLFSLELGRVGEANWLLSGAKDLPPPPPPVHHGAQCFHVGSAD